MLLAALATALLVEMLRLIVATAASVALHITVLRRLAVLAFWLFLSIRKLCGVLLIAISATVLANTWTL
jgi:hypothetical protein